jgi:hypothetical protein
MARLEPSKQAPRRLCFDAGYEDAESRTLLTEHGFTAHIRGRGEEIADKLHIPGWKARR